MYSYGIPDALAISCEIDSFTTSRSSLSFNETILAWFRRNMPGTAPSNQRIWETTFFLIRETTWKKKKVKWITTGWLGKPRPSPASPSPYLSWKRTTYNRVFRSNCLLPWEQVRPLDGLDQPTKAAWPFF